MTWFGRADPPLWRELVDTAEDRASKAEARAHLLQLEVKRLTDVIIELRKEGYAHVPPPAEVEEPDEVDQEVLTALYQSGLEEEGPEWNRAARQARLELARGVPKDQVIEGLEKGDDPYQYLD